jgi:hypothetical protein
LKIIQWNKGNIHLTGSLEEIEVLIKIERPDLLALSESMVLQRDTTEEICITGYSLEQADTFSDLAISRNCMHISNTVQYIRRTDLEESPISTVWVEIIVPGTSNVLVMGLYRQWSLPGDFGGDSDSNASQLARWQLICDQWSTALDEGKEVLVASDDNIDSVDWITNYSNSNRQRTLHLYNKLADKILTRGVVVLNNKITRQLGTNRPSILDHIYTTHPDKVVQAFTKTQGKSDHRMVGIVWVSKKPVHVMGYI